MLVAGSVDQDADAGPGIIGVEIEQIDRTDGASVGLRFDDQSQLAGFVDVATLVFDKALEHIFGKRRNGVAHPPNIRIIFPLIENVDIFGFQARSLTRSLCNRSMGERLLGVEGLKGGKVRGL